MATEPEIIVDEGVVTITENTAPGMAGRIGIIGAFDSEVTDLTLCTSKTTAHSIFGTMTTEGNFKGTDDIDLLFNGASSLLVANITTWSNDTASTTLTNEKLNAALELLTNEEFDLLFIADELSDAQQTIVSTWLATEMRHKYAHGQVAQLQKSTTAAYETSIATFQKNVYWICTQQYTYGGELLSLNRSAALMAGLIAGQMVNRSLTAKIIPGVTAVTPEYKGANAAIGAKLLELNVPFLKCKNRSTMTHYCVNSKLPDGYDLYVNRVRDYIINRIAVETYLGEINNPKTVEGVGTVVENIRYQCTEVLGLLKDFEYSVVKESSECIHVILEKLIFDNVVTEIKITYNIEVQ